MSKKYTNVRGYSTAQLLNRVVQLPSFKSIPRGYWLLGVRSNEDAYNVFDDKIYLFHGKEFIAVLTGTTNTGGYGLENFEKWSSRGAAIIKADEWYYNVWTRGRHRGKVDALVQTGAFKVIRDNNKNKKSGDKEDWSWETKRGLNFHPNSYNLKQKIKRWFIGKWSVGCIVVNDIFGYVNFMKISKGQKNFTFCLIDEF